MEYFRPAQKSDFDNFEFNSYWGKYMSEEVKALIERGNFRKAVDRFRGDTGLGVVLAKTYCENYQKHVIAKRDFEDGKQVFVPY